MFENVLGQPVIQILKNECEREVTPPALLFTGPEASGKLTAALETARVLSCAESGSWTCSCESCRRHKDLSSSDLLMLGTRDAVLEIKAAAYTLSTSKTAAVCYFFIRAVRKLTARFDSLLWDTDEPRFVKAVPLLSDIEELLAELTAPYRPQATSQQFIIEERDSTAKKKAEKQIEKITELCQKLQEECMYDTLLVSQVRKAAAWLRLMPMHKKKVLIIENADNMQEAARNAFLKILEEPPAYAVFILTAVHRTAVIPTILSRVRPYFFIERDAEYQRAVIERVFRNPQFCATASQGMKIISYLQSFLPVNAEQLQEAAAVFWEYCLKRGRNIKTDCTALVQVLAVYRKDYQPVCEVTVPALLKLINNAKPRRVYVLFLKTLLSFLSEGIRTDRCTPYELEYYAAFSSYIHAAMQEVNVFNSTAQAALETVSEKIAMQRPLNLFGD